MSIQRVRAFFESHNMGNRIMEFDTSSATVELAAQAVGCEPCHIAKTMSFTVGDEIILIVTAGDMKIDNAKFKACFSTKAKMASAEATKAATGHAPGGVCPFALNTEVRVYLDISLKRFDTVYPAAGNSASAIALTLDELEAYAAPVSWVDVCRVKTTDNIS